MTCLAGSPFVGTNSRGILGARATLSPSRDFALLGAAWRGPIQALASKASIVFCRERLGKAGQAVRSSFDQRDPLRQQLATVVSKAAPNLSCAAHAIRRCLRHVKRVCASLAHRARLA